MQWVIAHIASDVKRATSGAKLQIFPGTILAGLKIPFARATYPGIISGPRNWLWVAKAMLSSSV